MATIEVHARITSPISWMTHQPRKPSEKIVTTSHGRAVQMLARATIAATTGGQMLYSWKLGQKVCLLPLNLQPIGPPKGIEVMDFL